MGNELAEMRKEWGERLRIERVTRRLTQEQVAQLAEVNISTVCRAEAGNAGLEPLVRVALALGVTLEVAA